MSEEIDMEKVIVALTQGVGVNFGYATRKAFRDQLERLARHIGYIESSPKEKQALVDVLAMACFYQNVIIPIESSGSFISVLEAAGASHLRVAGDKLDQNFARRSVTIAGHYRWMLNEAHISEDLLTYSTLSDFISRVREFLRMQSNGPLD